MKKNYRTEVIPALQKAFGYKSVMAAPQIACVSVHTGFGRHVAGKTGEEQRKTLEAITADLQAITGQKPVLAKARKSIAGFKVRQGQPVGAKVTLRGSRMEGFLDKLVNVALARTRDFHGIAPRALDEQGNLTIGIPEHMVFPEISPEKVQVPFGLEVTVTTTANTKEEGLELFKQLGFPLKME